MSEPIRVAFYVEQEHDEPMLVPTSSADDGRVAMGHVPLVGDMVRIGTTAAVVARRQWWVGGQLSTRLPDGTVLEEGAVLADVLLRLSQSVPPKQRVWRTPR